MVAVWQRLPEVVPDYRRRPFGAGRLRAKAFGEPGCAGSLEIGFLPPAIHDAVYAKDWVQELPDPPPVTWDNPRS